MIALLAALQITAADPLLHLLQTPNMAVLLLAIGGLLIALEFHLPGWIVPGATGLLLILLAIHIFSTMPLRLSAVCTVLLALGLLAVEVKHPTRGIAAILGIAALVFGLDHLVAGGTPQSHVSLGVASGAGIGFGSIAFVLASIGERARREKVRTGPEAMVGKAGRAMTALAPRGQVLGQVLVRGELWQAELAEGEAAAGDSIVVTAVEGLLLRVKISSDAPRANE